MITLQPITSKNLDSVWLMKADPDLVAPNAWSLAEAFAYRSEYKQDPIAYAICHDSAPVGFVMALYNPPAEFMEDTINNNGQPYYYLWRLMIDDKHQKKGYGRAAMELLIAEAKASKYGKANAFYTGTEPKSTVTPKFYGSFGFVYTGEIDDGDEVMRLAF
ncbi:MAG: GNAT family N-acetyltransferase [Oscillospiraceae bacterium]|nr:GNAT family N-acetyltransferase [Oscillospiraceae bacterium]